jgi:hypothetical protein
MEPIIVVGVVRHPDTDARFPLRDSCRRLLFTCVLFFLIRLSLLLCGVLSFRKYSIEAV